MISLFENKTKNENLHDNIPNDETVKALEESNKGIGINVYSSYEEMYKKIKDEH